MDDKIVCPRCGSDDLYEHYQADPAYTCLECGYTFWPDDDPNEDDGEQPVGGA